MQLNVLVSLAIMLASAKIGGEICERYFKQPPVLGEIAFGMLIGQSGLHLVSTENSFLESIALLGSIFLLFEVGLESSVSELLKVGGSALWVACTGVLCPWLLTYFLAYRLGFVGSQPLFLGAALTATSVGITARVFSDLRSLQTKEAQIVLGAAVADDVIGLVLLAIISGLAITQHVSWSGTARLVVMALAFLTASMWAGRWAAPQILSIVYKMQTRAALPTATVVFCLLLSTMAGLIRLDPIVGAFTAGLLLSEVEHRVHFEKQISALASLFVPLFFTMVGMRLNLHSFNPISPIGRSTLILGSLFVLTAALGKILGGISVPTRSIKRSVVGVGMIPRGEVGLIFASIGLEHHLIDDKLYGVIIFVVMVTTFITPPLLKFLLKEEISSIAPGVAKSGKSLDENVCSPNSTLGG